MEKSLWQNDNDFRVGKEVKEDIETEILIIGAGITGVTTAYNLIDSGFDVVLIDREKFFNETTAKSTGKLTYLQDLKYQEICNIYDYETAKLYYESQKEAIRLVKKNVKENKIDCSLEKEEAITFTTDEIEVPKFIKEEKILEKLEVNYSNVSDTFKNNGVKHLISVKNTYVFNPVKYLKGLLKKIKKSNNIRIYENSIATKIRKDDDYYVAIVNDFEIKTKKIILTCNYPFFIIPGFIPLKTYMEKSYITATKVDKNKKINGITSNYPTTSFRFYEEKDSKFFIYLSNSSKICDKLNFESNYNDTINTAKKITGKKPTYKWTNMDVMTNDFLPLIGRISDEEKDVFIATGYNTWGMTTGTIAAKILVDLLKHKKNKYEKVFSPSRSMNLKKIKNFAVNTLSSNAKAYILNLIKKNPSWYKNKALVTKEDGKRIGIYFDEEGKKHKVSNICPHLKCFLTFNEVDKTWDCPCHGSRFDVDGNAIKGPSQYNIKIDETNE